VAFCSVNRLARDSLWYTTGRITVSW